MYSYYFSSSYSSSYETKIMNMIKRKRMNIITMMMLRRRTTQHYKLLGYFCFAVDTYI